MKSRFLRIQHFLTLRTLWRSKSVCFAIPEHPEFRKSRTPEIMQPCLLENSCNPELLRYLISESLRPWLRRLQNAVHTSGIQEPELRDLKISRNQSVETFEHLQFKVWELQARWNSQLHDRRNCWIVVNCIFRIRNAWDQACAWLENNGFAIRLVQPCVKSGSHDLKNLRVSGSLHSQIFGTHSSVIWIQGSIN